MVAVVVVVVVVVVAVVLAVEVEEEEPYRQRYSPIGYVTKNHSYLTLP